MSFTVLGIATDVRTGTAVVYTQMSIPDYLQIVGEDFEEFPLQRRRESYKAYDRLKTDIKDGALLPAITLSVKPHKVEEILPAYAAYRDDPNRAAGLAEKLNTADSVDILDGLQRTYIMQEIARSGEGFKEGQRILVEFWLEPDIHKLIYRIIVLNAGQKPMSLRHQIELLFASLEQSINEQLQDIEVYRERDNTRRSRPRKYPFNVVVSAYQALITQTPELQKNNIVANQLAESSALDASESRLSEQFDDFLRLLNAYGGFDEQVFRIYRAQSDGPGLTEPDDADGEGPPLLPANLINWMASENVMRSFFAAQAQFATKPERQDRVSRALASLQEELSAAEQGSDPLGLGTFNRLRAGVSPRKVNVGVATRRLLTNGFKEFFREGGDIRLADCWTLASD